MYSHTNITHIVQPYKYYEQYSHVLWKNKWIKKGFTHNIVVDMSTCVKKGACERKFKPNFATMKYFISTSKIYAALTSKCLSHVYQLSHNWIKCKMSNLKCKIALKWQLYGLWWKVFPFSLQFCLQGSCSPSLIFDKDIWTSFL